MRKNLLKSCLLATLSSLCCMSISAQDVHFVTSHKAWHMLEYSPKWYLNFQESKVADKEYDYVFSEKNDTVINGVEYKCLMKVNKGEAILAGIFREEGGKVYRYESMDKKEYLHYDFTLMTGDEFTIDSYYKGERYNCKVTSADEIELSNGQSARRICFDALPSDDKDYNGGALSSPNIWIEGVGNTQGPLVTAIDVNVVGGWLIRMPYVTMKDNLPLYTKELSTSNVYGQPCNIKEVSNSSAVNESNLQCEFIDHTLHIWGDIWSTNSPNQYIYCLVSKDKELKLVMEELGPIKEGMDSHKIDLRFDGFNAPGTYSIVDANGTHHINMGDDGNGADVIQHIIPVSTSTLYDLQGRKVGTQTRKGLYIKGGRKVMK